MASTLKELSWVGEDVCLADVDAALAQLRSEASRDRPSMRTSVMTHIAWVPTGWVQQARAALEGMAERHPSRTILLFPEPHADDNRIDARAEVERWEVPDTDRGLVTEVVELTLRGSRAEAPASIVQPLLVSDLPVFLRWRGEPPWGAQQLEQLVDVTDRLIVDSIEWDEVPGPYARLAELFPRCAASDIAWARTSRWRSHLATLWPAIGDVRTVGVRGTAAQAWLLCGWLRSRLGRDDIALEHDPAEQLEGVTLDGDAVPLPPGDPPAPSDVLSDELERFTPDPVYEAAVLATAE
ncbi:MAG TPA: glucose-6-phosphate dehydrogenase assembly protein OpcA [Gaiellaceae bacterium]|jgi:glucose-6-phosphate dehydrogenase assembly protein OpcA|nr:glucose-6-phosphate dehydrogenase assembly protein OpcA [Gaiellaceae bacterium]